MRQQVQDLLGRTCKLCATRLSAETVVVSGAPGLPTQLPRDSLARSHKERKEKAVADWRLLQA